MTVSRVLPALARASVMTASWVESAFAPIDTAASASAAAAIRLRDNLFMIFSGKLRKGRILWRRHDRSLELSVEAENHH